MRGSFRKQPGGTVLGEGHGRNMRSRMNVLQRQKDEAQGALPEQGVSEKLFVSVKAPAPILTEGRN